MGNRKGKKGGKGGGSEGKEGKRGMRGERGGEERERKGILASRHTNPSLLRAPLEVRVCHWNDTSLQSRVWVHDAASV